MIGVLRAPVATNFAIFGREFLVQSCMLSEIFTGIPVLPFLGFFGIPCFSPTRISLFFERFPFFSRDFRGSVAIENPCFFGGFPCLFQEKQGKEGQGFEAKIGYCNRCAHDPN